MFRRILGFFRRWRERRRYRDRFIFQFWDGVKQRAVDPIVVWRNLNDDAELLMPDDIHAADQGDIEAASKVVRAVRRVFAVQPWNESTAGLTESECLALLIGFWDFVESVKKNIVATPTSPSPTELPHSATSTTQPASA